MCDKPTEVCFAPTAELPKLKIYFYPNLRSFQFFGLVCREFDEVRRCAGWLVYSSALRCQRAYNNVVPCISRVSSSNSGGFTNGLLVRRWSTNRYGDGSTFQHTCVWSTRYLTSDCVFLSFLPDVCAEKRFLYCTPICGEICCWHSTFHV